MTATATTLQTAPPPVQANPPRMTWEEFLAWMGEENRAEWVNGAVELMSPSEVRHQRIMKFLHHLLDAYFSERPVGEAFPPPFLMRLPERPSGREPDLLVLLHEHKERLKTTYLDGPADIVVEIISEESQARDRGEKFAEYEAAGVTEYWLIDPLRDLADFYHLGAGGRYERLEPDADGRCHSRVLPGLQINPRWLWPETLPDLSEALDMVRAMLAG